MLGVLILLFISSPVSAHPTYIRVGYASCTGCHQSSQGGGLLTPYGQGIAATQSIITPQMEDDEEMPEKKYLQAFQARVLNYKTKEETRTFPMQMDYLAQLKLSKSIMIDGVLAVAPKPKDVAPGEEEPAHKRMYARVLSATWILPTKLEQRIRVGVGMLPIGLGLVDHTAYVRSDNRLQVTDNPIAAVHYFASKSFQGHSFVYLPNPHEEEENRESGMGMQLWWKAHQNIAIGVQGLSGESDSIKRRLGGLLLKAGKGRFAFLSEINRTWRELTEDKSEFRQWSWMNELSVFPWASVRVFASLQGLERDRNFLAREQRQALGMDVRVWGRVTLAFEARTRVSGELTERSQLLQAYLNWW